MNKRSTLLGLLLFGIAASLCSFTVSAKEKTDYSKCDIGISNVSHGTFVMSFNGDQPGSTLHSFALLPDIDIRFYVLPAYGDPYQVRSQRWIKWNNIDAIGKGTKDKNANVPGPSLSRLNC